MAIADDYHLRIDFSLENLNAHNDQVLRYYIEYYRKNIEDSATGAGNTQ